MGPTYVFRIDKCLHGTNLCVQNRQVSPWDQLMCSEYTSVSMGPTCVFRIDKCLHGTNLCVQNRQVFSLYKLFILTKISYFGTLAKVWYLQNSCLFRFRFRQSFLYL
jgi:hypothetical protein